MKNFLLTLLCLLVATPLFAQIFPYEYEGKTLYYCPTLNGDCFVEENPQARGSIIIPDAVTFEGKEHKVKHIEFGAFANCDSLINVNLPKHLKIINSKAFEGCKSLTSVSFADSLFLLGDCAFKDCLSLKSINLKGDLECIGNSTFSNCKSLTSVILPNSVETIWDKAFENCENLRSIILSNNLVFIADRVFNGCKSLTTITLPESLSTLSRNTFEKCTNLKSIISLATTPPGVYGNLYNKSVTSATIYVPDQSIEAYRQALWWKEFASIQGISASAPVIGEDGQIVKTMDGHIHISNAPLGSKIKVTDINGATIAQATVDGVSQTIALNRNGVFVVNINGKPYKLVL